MLSKVASNKIHYRKRRDQYRTRATVHISDDIHPAIIPLELTCVGCEWTQPKPLRTSEVARAVLCLIHGPRSQPRTSLGRCLRVSARVFQRVRIGNEMLMIVAPSMRERPLASCSIVSQSAQRELERMSYERLIEI